MLKLTLSYVPLVALWALMSGIFEPMLIVFGLISSALAIWIMRRMENADGEHFSVGISPPKTILYLFWLLKEIALSTWNVTKIVLQGRPNFNQRLFCIPVSQTNDPALVIFANSITLTPGTITVETEPGYFLVHALNHSAGDYDDLSEMDSRVSALEYEQDLVT